MDRAGIICGKYSFDREDVDRQQRIIDDIRDSPGQVFCFQEATDAFCQALNAPSTAQNKDLVRKRMENKRTPATLSPAPRILVVRGAEQGNSTAVTVRDVHFKAIRRDAFMLLDGGQC